MMPSLRAFLVCSLLGLCPIAWAAEPPTLTVWVSNTFSNDIVYLMLPMRFSMHTSSGGDMPVTLVDNRYCGASREKRPGNSLGVLYPGSSPAQDPTPLLQEEDCRLDPSAIAARILGNAEAPEWIAIAEMQFHWHPWQLELLPVALHSYGKSGHPASRFQLGQRPVKIYGTSGIRIQIEKTTVPMHAAVRFADQAVSVDALVAETPPAHIMPVPDTRVNEQEIPPGTNAIVIIPHTVANMILTEYLNEQPYEIQLADPVPRLIVTHPAVIGDTESYTTTSVLGIREYPDAFDVEVHWEGPDLQLAKLLINPRNVPCRSSELLCRGKKVGLEALAASLTQVLSSHYRQTPLRAMSSPNVFPIKIGEKDAAIQVDVLRAESRDTDLVLYTEIKIGR
ncbi:MAG TPA: hypothetical protein VJ692_07880 [Nitrospiraceae bacterium]|nr:hypothetical protein [Nitrospiraceae bacterium]